MHVCMYAWCIDFLFGTHPAPAVSFQAEVAEKYGMNVRVVDRVTIGLAFGETINKEDVYKLLSAFGVADVENKLNSGDWYICMYAFFNIFFKCKITRVLIYLCIYLSMYVCMYVCMNYYRSHCRIWGPGKHLQVSCPHHTFLNPPQLQQVCTVCMYVCIHCF